MQGAARTHCAKHNSHTCTPSGIFSDIHAAGENDLILFAALARQTLRDFFDSLMRPPEKIRGPHMFGGQFLRQPTGTT